MKKLELTREETSAIVGRIQDYFRTELDDDIGNIPAEMLLRFFTDEIGGYYYNRGLGDAQAVLMGKVDEFTDGIYGLEQSTLLRR